MSETVAQGNLKRVDLVLAWHMHQPDYRDHATGEFRLPWTYLHAMKDYSDMAWHLEQHPGVRAVVNFTPVLLEQLDDYRDQLASGLLRDPLLQLLAREGPPFTDEERAFVLARCTNAGHERMFSPLTAYAGLRDIFEWMKARGAVTARYLSDQYLFDLLTWYHLAWLGETVRRSSETATRLMSLGAGFTADDRRSLVSLIRELVGGIVARYRKLAEQGRIEISTTPACHPLAPLLLNLRSAREANAEIRLPASREYPGGRERVTAQLEAALRVHREHFGQAAGGAWPAEGAISPAFVALLGSAGCRWTASAEAVLVASLRAGGQPVAPSSFHRIYRVGDTAGPAIFFRDDRLSDLIGFEYPKWNSQDAASNFIAALEAVAASADGESPVVSVILDGENCWEHYDYNGYYFLEELYRRLESHPAIRTTTFAARLAEAETRIAPLNRVAAGSWSHGNFADWIGSPDKNRAWDLLCAAKQSYDLVMASGRPDAVARREAARQLAACEGSDWFWWLGRAVDSDTESFDALFRTHLSNLYRFLSLPVPAVLAEPIRGAAPVARPARQAA